MAVAIGTGRMLTMACLGALLAGCGGGGVPSSELLSGTAAVGAPLVDAAVRLRCADGSILQATTNHLGVWQLVVASRPLPCAVQASGGTVRGVAHPTAYHSVALAYGVNNITPLTSLVLARLLKAPPQAWFDSPSFSAVHAAAVLAARNEVAQALQLETTLQQSNPLTTPLIANPLDYQDAILEGIANTLADPGVNKTFDELLAAVSTEPFTSFGNFGPTFAAVYVAPGR